jgi:carbon monoxide dehydrogenase subunit G
LEESRLIVEGKHVIAAPRERVFDALSDPAVLARALPGCKQLVDEGDGVYGLTIEAGAGSVRGAYSGHVRIGERDRPSVYQATLGASGTAGSVEAALRADLSEAEGVTEVAYRMDAKVAGAIAGVGQRVLAGVSRKNASAFFTAFEAELSAPALSIAEATPTGDQQADAPGAARVYAGKAGTGGERDAMGWFVRGLVVGSILSAVAIRLAKRPRH